MTSLHGTILRALTVAALSIGAGSGVSGASDPPSGTRPTAAPVVLSEGRPPAPLRRLTPRGEAPLADESGRSGLPSAGSALSALAVVVLLIFGASRLWKTHGPKLPGAAPREVIEVLGRCRIESRQSVYLVRLGSRVLVLGSSGGELSTLSEVTDAVEVDLIAAQCRDAGGVQSPFSRLFEARRRAEHDSADGPGEQAAPPAEPRPSRWFRSPAEQRLADRVRGRAVDEEAGRVA